MWLSSVGRLLRSEVHVVADDVGQRHARPKQTWLYLAPGCTGPIGNTPK